MSYPTPAGSEPRTDRRLALLAAVCLVGVAANHAWAFASAHLRKESSLAIACRYFNTCEVCVNKGGVPVCGKASYVEKDLALRVAWFRACERAIPINNHSAELRVLATTGSRPLDPCRMETSLALDPGSGFYTMSDAERRCMARNADAQSKDVERVMNDLDGYVRESEKTIETTVAAETAIHDALRKARSAMWSVCVSALPRYSARCEAASDLLHVESPGPGVPAGVMSFGR